MKRGADAQTRFREFAPGGHGIIRCDKQRTGKAARMNLGSESETVEFKKSTGEHKEALQAISAMLCQKVKTQAQT